MKNNTVSIGEINYQDFLKLGISEQFLRGHGQEIKEKLIEGYKKLDFKIKMFGEINPFTIHFTKKDIKYLINKKGPVTNYISEPKKKLK